MLVANRTPAPLSDPKLVDIGIAEINSILSANLSWLSAAYGACERLSRTKDGQTYAYPAIYAGGGPKSPYIELFPDEHLGNYSFFDLADRIEWEDMGQGLQGRVEFGLVFWFRYDEVFPDPLNPDEYNSRNVEDQILTLFKNNRFPHVRVEIRDTFRQARNIYRDYTHRELKDQFLMRPYGGLRFEGVLYFFNLDNC